MFTAVPEDADYRIASYMITFISCLGFYLTAVTGVPSLFM